MALTESRRPTRSPQGRPRRPDWRRPAWLDATGEWVRDRAKLLDSPLATHHVLLATTSLLVVIGLVMVLSSSSIDSLRDNGNAFAVFKNQATFAVLGAVVLVLASRVPAGWWQRLALPALAFAVVFQLAVFTPLGDTVGGNRNWVRVGSFSAQPSEAAKVALVLALALALARRRDRLHEPKQLIGALLPSVAGTVGLVLATRDLGTAMVMMAMVVAMLWTSGLPVKFFALAGGFGATVAVLLVVSSTNRLHRVEDWLFGTATSGEAIQGVSWQPVQSQYALASGGFWGLGLGASREKWQWLPEAHNDFIFAIIGEELGLPGTLSVLVLFAVIALAALRLVRRSEDLFTKLAVAGFAAWILGQACLNIGVVLGLLPVIGVPLPFISQGGSALVVVLLAIGILLSFARAEPGAPEALKARESVVARSLAVLPRRSTGPAKARR